MPIDLKAAQNFINSDRKRREALGLFNNEGGYNWFTIKDDGDYELRVLEWGDFMSGSHWGVLEGKDGRAGGSIRCPKAYNNSPCPICEEVVYLSKSTDPIERERAKNQQVKIKYPLLLLDLNEQGDQFVPRIYEAPKTIWEAVFIWSNNPKWGDITDFNTGRNLSVNRDKSRKMKMYQVQPDPKATPIDLTGIELPNLREALAPRSYEDIQHALLTGEMPPLPKDEQKQKPARPVPKTLQNAQASKPQPAQQEAPVESHAQPARRLQAQAPARRAAPPAPAPEPETYAGGDDDRFEQQQEAQDDDADQEPPAPPVRQAPRAAAQPTQRPLAGPAASNQSLRDRLAQRSRPQASK